MLALERILGKDVSSIIFLQLHQTLMQQLNAEYCACVRPRYNDSIVWTPQGNELLYNFRVLGRAGRHVSSIYDKHGAVVAELPKIY